MEENSIVNEISFGESSTGAAIVHGSFVAQGASEYLTSPSRMPAALTFAFAAHARLGGPFGNRGGTESREQTIANGNIYSDLSPFTHILTILFLPTASRKIQQVATALRLSEIVALAATRLYTLAVEHKFTKGRKSLNVVAVCLYVACRQKETRNYMLIDFSDLLQVRT